MSAKPVKYTIHNTFHRTQVSFYAAPNQDGDYAAYVDLMSTEFHAHRDSKEYATAHRKLNRIRRVLCGSKACQCGGMIKGGEA